MSVRNILKNEQLEGAGRMTIEDKLARLGVLDEEIGRIQREQLKPLADEREAVTYSIAEEMSPFKPGDTIRKDDGAYAGTWRVEKVIPDDPYGDGIRPKIRAVNVRKDGTTGERVVRFTVGCYGSERFYKIEDS